MKIGQDVFIHQGILDGQIEQLIEYSQNDSGVKKFTSDALRFANRKSFHNWQEKGRIIYTLSDSQKNLLGIIWFGQKEAPLKDIKANFTFAIRIYASARGRGLSSEFMEIVFKDLFKNQTESKITGLWLQVSSDNLAAVHSYQKAGFKTAANLGYDNKIIMVLKKQL